MSRDFTNDTSKYLDMGDASALDFTSNSFTVMAWGHQDSFGNQRTWVAKANSQSSNLQYILWVEGSSGGNERMSYGDGSSQSSADGSGPVSTTEFVHLCGRVGTGSGGVDVFNNAVVAGSSTPGPTVGNTAHAFRVGRPVSNADPMDGRLCEVAVWSALLNDDEIEAVYRGLCPRHVRTHNLVGYWPIHGRSPEPDYSGKGHNPGTVNGSPAYHSTHARVSPFVLG